MQKIGVKRVSMMLIGIFLIGVSVGLFREANLGTDPFSCMNLGISGTIGMQFGTLQLIVNILIFIVIIITCKNYIGIGTIINMVCVGFIADYTIWWFDGIFKDELGIILRSIFLLIGIGLICLGAALYMTADLGIAPYDATAFVIEKLTSGKIHFKMARIVTDAICVIAGFLLGSTIGIGTLLLVICTGPLIQFFRARMGDGSPKVMKDFWRTVPLFGIFLGELQIMVVWM